jgi:hypothetical protein
MKKNIILIFLAIIIIFSGCIQNDENIKYGKPGDIEIKININNNVVSINNSSLPLNVKIKNISDRTIKISNHVKDKVGIYTYLIIDNITYLNSGNSANFEEDKTIELNKNEKIEFNYDIFSIGFLEYMNKTVGDHFNFPQIGDFSLYIEYKSHNYQTLAISNTIQFMIE